MIFLTKKKRAQDISEGTVCIKASPWTLQGYSLKVQHEQLVIWGNGKTTWRIIKYKIQVSIQGTYLFLKAPVLLRTLNINKTTPLFSL